MIVILSQKVDTDSTYSDDLFKSYHYPAKYKKQLHEGDIFVYCQGNRHDKSQRYYFGAGKIGRIRTSDGENYYAELIESKRFPRTVPIYLPDGGYIEQMGYEEVRKSINPPWQSSVRPLSKTAYEYILSVSGLEKPHAGAKDKSIETLKEMLKTAVRDFYVGGESRAIYQIQQIASEIADTLFGDNKGKTEPCAGSNCTANTPAEPSALMDYCKIMKMS